mgnify:FL=1
MAVAGVSPMNSELRMADLTTRFGVARWTIHRWIREDGFPPGVTYPGSKGKVWRVAEVDVWDNARHPLLMASDQ